jgi:small subunit ribosomal protein S16
MLKIRLTRKGKKNQPFYRIVVTESAWKRDGKYIHLLGHYNPLAKSVKIKLNKKAYQEWIKKGAQPSKTVKRLADSLK